MSDRLGLLRILIAATVAGLSLNTARAAVPKEVPSAITKDVSNISPPPLLDQSRNLGRVTLNCAEGRKSFPFLKPWVEKLENFAAPVETGMVEGSLFYSIGATAVGKRAVSAWQEDVVTLPLEAKQKDGRLESVWLGEWPQTLPSVQPGPGSASIERNRLPLPTQKEAARKSVVMSSSDHGIKDLGFKSYSPSRDLKGQSPYWARVWKLLFSPEEVGLLEACSASNCKIKFTDTELKEVVGASHQYRLEHFKRILQARVDEFRKNGKLWEYEGTKESTDWQNIRLSQAFPPQLNTHFWLPRDRSTYGYEHLDAEPGHHKPVTALFSRQCEKRGDGAGSYTVCTDLVLYNNHYFDFWGRIVLFFPWCDTQVALAYETLDIDQLKSSRMVRAIFGSEMRRLVGELLETRLKRLHMLGN